MSVLVGLTIAVGLVVDRIGGNWGQPLVSLWAWGVAGLLWWRERAWRSRLVACLLIATAGELVLSLVWGLYDYRLGNLPLFVPPGHVLLYWLGLQWADRLPERLFCLTPWLALAAVSALALARLDWLGPPLLLIFLAWPLAGRPMLQIDFISDVSCPWCAIGLNALEAAAARVAPEVAVQIRFQPFRSCGTRATWSSPRRAAS